MSLHDALKAIEAWPLSEEIQVSSWMFPAIETAHVVAITLVFGTVLIVDLRVLGLASGRRPVTALSHEVLPWTWAAFILAAISGGLMFISKADGYFFNLHFLLKMCLLLAAGLNMALFHIGPFQGVADWDEKTVAPARARLACALSLGIWLGVVTLGRWIGFTLTR